VAELIPETAQVVPGQPFDVALHLHMDPGWHTYWVNSGDAGLPTSIKWTLPPGFTAGPIRWPTPEIHAMGPLVTYGYGGDVYLLTTITPPLEITRGDPNPVLKAHATWLVCEEECIPGRADFSVALVGGSQSPLAKTFFAAARARLPVANTRWEVSGSYGASNFSLVLKEKNPSQPAPTNLRFFPEQPNVLGNQASDQGAVSASGGALQLAINLAQNGTKPAQLSGVLVSDTPLIGDAKAVEIGPFPVTAVPEGQPTPGATASTPNPASSSSPTSLPPAAPSPTLIAVLLAAFLGGLILNLMPCVLPVLSLKVFSLIRHAGEGGALRQGLAFTAGVVLSFWALAGLLLILRDAGSELGWGFQMQSPGFVLALIYLFFLLGLNLLGVFEIGTSLVGLDAKASGRATGLASSFLNGALATLAATPCTAPFMGSALGFAARQTAAIAMLVFTFLALGMAAPYLLLTAFPAALRFVPKPGPWMEALRSVMGFLLLGTVIFLLYVFGALTDSTVLPALLGALLASGLAAWIYGRWCGPIQPARSRAVAFVLALVFVAASLALALPLLKVKPASMTPAQDGWQTYSADAVSRALAARQPVFVDFTAAWCLSCKVNERVALDAGSVQAAFAQKHVLLLRGDWTHSDPAITAALRRYNRDGVPLYLLYSPQAPDDPQVLPAVLTPGIVLDALQRL
jgi:thiol:disulfide interchange protein DsbD